MDRQAGTAPSSANGLRNAFDIVIAPKDALERLSVAPTWGWALLIVLVLYALASFLVTPALLHAMTADWPRQIAANPRLAAITADQQQQALGFTLKIVQFSWVFAPIVVFPIFLLHTVIMLIFKALGKGSASFAALWASAANIAIPVLALNALIGALIVLLRGTDAFSSPAEIQTVVPSLGMLVDPSSLKLHAGLALINPFTLWGCGLTVAAMIVVAKLDRAWAWTTGIVWLLFSALLAGLLAR